MAFGPTEHVQQGAADDSDAVVKADKRTANDNIRGMKLLTKENRRRLPPLYSQDGKGGKAVARVKCLTPRSSWTWYATEFDGEDTFFGLVEGQFKELGYFCLSELESVRGPMGPAIERDLHWKPKTLEEIAPEMFSNNEQSDSADISTSSQKLRR